MKHLRIFILALLAVLLPVRGAVAATMACPKGQGTGPVAAVCHHAMQAGSAMHADPLDARAHAGQAAAHGDSSSGEHPTTCHLCASGCCMASIAGTVPSPVAPGLVSRLTFPALIAPVPAFQSDGQDRPPRTI